jgi:hypothetical protein
LLEKIKPYFELPKLTNAGDNRNSVTHGYMHLRFWNKLNSQELTDAKGEAVLSEYVI